MAWSFNGSTFVNISAGSVPTIGYPYSIFVRASHANTTTEGYPFGVALNGVADSDIQLGFRGDVASDPVELRRGNSSPATTTVARSAAGYTAGTWVSIGAYSTNSTTFGIYKDGVHTAGAGTTNYPTTGLMNIQMGAFAPDNSAKLTGGVFTPALWNVTLTADEFIALHKGCPPWRIRPQSRLFYMRCVRDTERTDSDGTRVFNSGGGTLATTDCPSVYGRP